MLRKVSRRFGGLLGGGKSGGGDVGKFGLSIALVVAVVVWVVSGFYTIREAERGVVLRFGEYSTTWIPVCVGNRPSSTG